MPDIQIAGAEEQQVAFAQFVQPDLRADLGLIVGHAGKVYREHILKDALHKEEQSKLLV